MDNTEKKINGLVREQQKINQKLSHIEQQLSNIFKNNEKRSGRISACEIICKDVLGQTRDIIKQTNVNTQDITTLALSIDYFECEGGSEAILIEPEENKDPTEKDVPKQKEDKKGDTCCGYKRTGRYVSDCCGAELDYTNTKGTICTQCKQVTSWHWEVFEDNLNKNRFKKEKKKIYLAGYDFSDTILEKK